MNTFQREKPAVHPVKKVSFPPVGSYRLKNDVPVYLIEAGNEEIMRMEIVFRAGQVREQTPLLSSTANLMLMEGSLNFTSEELSRTLDLYGTFINLLPEKDMAGVVIFFLNKHTGKVLELIREIIFRPSFPEAEMEALMKKRARWFLINREKTSSIANDQLFESLFGKKHPYGQRILEQHFEMLTPGLVREFHTRYYTPGNMAIIISGKIHPGILSLLDGCFGEIPATEETPGYIVPAIKSSVEKEIHITKKDAVQTALRIGAPTINKRSLYYPGLKVVNTILGGYFGSRLMRNIREEKGYTYGITSMVTSLDLSGYMVISTEVNPKHRDETIDEVLKEIQKLQKEPLDNEELGLVRSYMSGELLRMFDGPFATAESFRSVWEFGLDGSYFNRLTEKILNIGQDEIIELARTYYNIDDLYKITAGP
jgi:zinc protease